MAHLPRVPDLNAQRAAMGKLAFLVGKWKGEARLLRGPGEWVELHLSEEAQYKLDGLILVIEGVGRTQSDGHSVLQALAVISFDDEAATYRMRAFNDGRFLESDVTLLDRDKAISWGFAVGQVTTQSVLRINESGEWTEVAEFKIGAELPKRLLELLSAERTKYVHALLLYGRANKCLSILGETCPAIAIIVWPLACDSASSVIAWWRRS